MLSAKYLKDGTKNSQQNENRVNYYRFYQVLPAIGKSLDSTDHIHSFCNLSKSGETSPIWISVSSIIKRRLISETDKYLGGGASRFIPGHRDNPVGVQDAGTFRAFMFNAGVCSQQVILEQSPLDDLDLDRIIRLVIGADHPVKDGSVVNTLFGQGIEN